MPLLTKDERKALDKDARIALRDERKQAKWPDTDGVPPWVIEARERAAEAGKVLAAAAIEGVKLAAKLAIKGVLKNNEAVAHVMTATGIDEDRAIEAVFNAFEKLETE